MDFLVDKFKKENGIDLKNDMLALQRLKDSAEKAKIELSSAASTDINLPYITADASGPKHLNIKLTRAKFESLVEDLIQRSIDPCKTALSDAKVTAADIDEVILVGGQTRMPKVQEEVEKLFGKAPRKDVNPDEAVAIGAAIQGAVLSGSIKDVLLLDVTPLSLGIETMGGIMSKLIHKNTTIPTKQSQTFSTADDNQPAVTIKVHQGEREMAQHNKLLGEFNLEGIDPAPRGMPQIEVTFDIDANGILHVTAKDKATGKEQKVTITASTNLNKNDIDRMVNEARSHEADDRKRRELIDAKNNADSLIYQTEKALRDLGDKVPSAERGAIESKINDLKSAAQTDDLSRIQKATEQLQQAFHALSQQLYAQGQPQPGAAGGPSTPPPSGPNTLTAKPLGRAPWWVLPQPATRWRSARVVGPPASACSCRCRSRTRRAERWSPTSRRPCDPQ